MRFIKVARLGWAKSNNDMPLPFNFMNEWRMTNALFFVTTATMTSIIVVKLSWRQNYPTSRFVCGINISLIFSPQAVCTRVSGSGLNRFSCSDFVKRELIIMFVLSSFKQYTFLMRLLLPIILFLCAQFVCAETPCITVYFVRRIPCAVSCHFHNQHMWSVPGIIPASGSHDCITRLGVEWNWVTGRRAGSVHCSDTQLPGKIQDGVFSKM